MRLALLGGTGSIGREVLAQALAGGHQVRALVRDPAGLEVSLDGMGVLVGAAPNGAAVAELVAGSDAVINALGPKRNSRDQVELFEQIARNLVAAMQQHGVKRLITLSGAAVDAPGDQKSILDRGASRLVRIFVPHVVAAKQREFSVIRKTDLDWTAVRPPRVVDGPRTGHYNAGTIPLGFGTITTGDLADFMLRELIDERYVRSAPFVVTARAARS
ncbi:MAG: NAD(P)-dependent oxidoreductase [Candidatus Limnocylindrales bacterium]